MSDVATPISYFAEELPSTNLHMRTLMESRSLPSMSLVRASFQSEGRGQAGNGWESEKGMNLLFSLLLRPTHLPIMKQFYLSRAVSLGITDVLNRFENRFEIKWPNDIYHGEKKIAGILIENNLKGPFINFSIAGIGLNINQKEFCSDAPNPVSLCTITKKNHDLEEVLSLIIGSVARWIESLNHHDYDTIDNAYNKLLYRREGWHSYRDENGTFEAEIERVEPTGLLVLKDRQGHSRSYAFKEVAYITNQNL